MITESIKYFHDEEIFPQTAFYRLTNNRMIMTLTNLNWCDNILEA